MDANGGLKYTGDVHLDDWMGSYSHDTGSEFFAHSSVHRDEFGTTGQDTVIASLVPTTDAHGRVGSVNEVWDELLERIPLPPGTTADQSESMLKQLACHLLHAIPDHECNWGFEGDRLPSPGAS